MQITSLSTDINQILPPLLSGIGGFIAIIVSAFFGGLFAGLWTNHFEMKRRIRDKRTDRYYEHRNTIVQIEQELIPLRVNISRNIASIGDAIANTHDTNIRFILRFHKLKLSTGLGLKLLSIDMINEYAQLYSAIETFNSDIEYVSGMVSSVKEDKKTGQVDPTLIESYKVFLPHLKDECDDIDLRSLKLLSMSKVAIGAEDKKTRDKYVSDGLEIKYSFTKSSLNKKNEEIKFEEDASSHKDEKQPKFVAPYMDLKKVLIQVRNP